MPIQLVKGLPPIGCRLKRHSFCLILLAMEIYDVCLGTSRTILKSLLASVAARHQDSTDAQPVSLCHELLIDLDSDQDTRVLITLLIILVV